MEIEEEAMRRRAEDKPVRRGDYLRCPECHCIIGKEDAGEHRRWHARLEVAGLDPVDSPASELAVEVFAVGDADSQAREHHHNEIVKSIEEKHRSDDV